MEGPNDIEILLKTIPWFNELKPEHFEKLAETQLINDMFGKPRFVKISF